MVERREHYAAFFERAKTVEPDGVEPVEDVAILAMLWFPTMFIDEALDVLEPSNDALLARRTPALLFRLREIRQFSTEIVEV